MPTIGGSTKFPVDSGGSSVDITAKTILENLDFTFMGTFEAHNGQWGVFTDLMYLNLGAGKSNSRDFSIGGGALSANTSANLNLDFRGLIWTLAGERQVLADPAVKLNLLAGTRLFSSEQTLDWTISGDLGSLPEASRSGSSTVKESWWDAIVGVKGTYTYAPGSKWSSPFYFDIGAGESQLTWQAATGVSYAFEWGQMSALWRYLSYDMKSGGVIQDVSFNGPMLGATFKW